MVDPMQASAYLVTSLGAGLAGAGAMTVVLTVITRIPMIEAVGSLMTRQEHASKLAGSFAHVSSGMFFGLLYTLAMVTVGDIGPWPLIGFGALLGFVHGVAVSLVLVFAIAERHPVERFQDCGFPIAMAHLAGHVAFGLVAGAVVAFSGITSSGI